jgi:hypothetical protein
MNRMISKPEKATRRLFGRARNFERTAAADP